MAKKQGKNLLWKNFFKDPLQWLDNRNKKVRFPLYTYMFMSLEREREREREQIVLMIP